MDSVLPVNILVCFHHQDRLPCGVEGRTIKGHQCDLRNASDAIPVTALAEGRIAIESSTHRFLG